MENIINHGVIEGIRGTDFAAGTLPFEVRNPSGDWTPYLPPGEWQKNNVMDTHACVTFSALNSLETQYKLITGEERNFSDRFTARMSGTTIEGNWLFKVADSIRKDGIVDEELWPTSPNMDFDTYYLSPPIEVVNKAKEFLKEWKVAYEWVEVSKESFLHHLQQSPLQIVIPGHAVLGFFRNEDVTKYFDSYAPFMKERTTGITSALKFVLSKAETIMTEAEVKKEYALAFYRLPDATELAYWTGKSLSDFLTTAMADRAKFLADNNQ